jgi:DNA-directed RNA polymerase specialized sigma24 family protein
LDSIEPDGPSATQRARLPAVLAFAAVLTGQRATAEDIAQEVLIRACARRDTIGGPDRPEFYVRRFLS